VAKIFGGRYLSGMTTVTTRKEQHQKELSLKYQWDFIQRIKEQVEFFNNPEISPDYMLYLKIAKRRISL
jgi:hypothetical protein